MTSLCRDVVATADMDEYGHGATNPSRNQPAVDSRALFLGLFGGIIVSLMIYRSARRDVHKKADHGDYGDVQFSSIPSGESTMEPESVLT